MKSALPRPHPARNPMIASTDPAAPASAANTMTSTRPASSVRFTPMRLETQLVKNIAMPVMKR